MYLKGRHGGGSLPMLLLVLLSLLTAARVQPSPFADYESVRALPPRTYPNRYDSDTRLKVVYEPNDYEEQVAALQEYEFRNAKSDQASAAAKLTSAQRAPLDSTKNLQQILRSFPLVVGGHVPPPSSSSPYDVWRSLQEDLAGDPRPFGGGGRGPETPLAQARLPDLPFGEARPKRVMCHFKICNLGRRRRARQSSPLQGWLS